MAKKGRKRWAFHWSLRLDGMSFGWVDHMGNKKDILMKLGFKGGNNDCAEHLQGRVFALFCCFFIGAQNFCYAFVELQEHEGFDVWLERNAFTYFRSYVLHVIGDKNASKMLQESLIGGHSGGVTNNNGLTVTIAPQNPMILGADVANFIDNPHALCTVFWIVQQWICMDLPFTCNYNMFVDVRSNLPWHIIYHELNFQQYAGQGMWIQMWIRANLWLLWVLMDLERRNLALASVHSRGWSSCGC